MKIKSTAPKMVQEHQKNEQKKMKKSHQGGRYDNVPKEYMKVAQGMESQFVNHLLTEMRKTVNKLNPESSTERFYNSMIDYENAQQIAQNQSVGIKDVILEQIVPKQYLKTQKPNLNHKLQHEQTVQMMKARKEINHE